MRRFATIILTLALCLTAHGAITVTARGTGANNTGATTLVITPGSNLAAGSTGVIVVALDNAGSGGATPAAPSAATDSVGNSWERVLNPIYDPAGASAGVETAYYVSRLSVAFTTANNLTLTWAGAASVTAKAWTLWELAPASGKYVGYITGAAGTGASSGTPTVTTGSITNGDVVIGGGGAESADTWTGDADTTNGAWTSKQAIGAGTGTSGMSVISQAKVVNATATQTFNPTLTSADQILGWIQLREITPPSSGFFLFFR